MAGGNRAEILNNGDEIFSAMTKAIREAKASVNLESYIFKDDRAGKISPGVKFKDAELIGVPTIVTVGRGLADQAVLTVITMAARGSCRAAPSRSRAPSPSS